jgi:hypothetical protein
MKVTYEQVQAAAKLLGTLAPLFAFLPLATLIDRWLTFIERILRAHPKPKVPLSTLKLEAYGGTVDGFLGRVEMRGQQGRPRGRSRGAHHYVQQQKGVQAGGNERARSPGSSALYPEDAN